jgi:hypothetical protein
VNLPQKPDSQNSYWQNNSYSPLLNQQALLKGLKRNLWKYELKSMLNGFINDISEFKQELKFRVSGKILNSSTYVLKRKSNTVINNSLETQEDIRDTQIIETGTENLNVEDIPNEEYDDEQELFKVFAELEGNKLLNEDQLASFKEEKLKRILNLEISELNNLIKDKINLLQIYSKPIYKKIEFKDLSESLHKVLKAKATEITSRKPESKKIDKSKLPFLPESLIANAEKKRLNFESRIKDFYENLKSLYSDEPVLFLDLIHEPTAKALVNTLLIVLHLINQKKIELWKKCDQIDGHLNESDSENTGQTIFISPL